MHKAGRSIEEICKVMNHSHPAITMRYIGITQEDMDRSYTNFERKKATLEPNQTSRSSPTVSKD